MSDDAHSLMPEHLLANVPLIGETEREYDPLARVKYFTPDSSWTWYVIEYDDKERLCFGLVFGAETEFGTFSLKELEELRGPWAYGLSETSTSSQSQSRSCIERGRSVGLLARKRRESFLAVLFLRREKPVGWAGELGSAHPPTKEAVRFLSCLLAGAWRKKK